jgi:hypothetical protein
MAEQQHVNTALTQRQTAPSTGKSGQIANDNLAISCTDPPQVATASLDKLNTAWCDCSRLFKAAIATAIVAGDTLELAQLELGNAFSEVIDARTPWNAAEARALIRFSSQIGLQPAQLAPPIAVPLARTLEAVALLGKLYVEEANNVDRTI